MKAINYAVIPITNTSIIFFIFDIILSPISQAFKILSLFLKHLKTSCLIFRVIKTSIQLVLDKKKSNTGELNIDG